MPSTENIGSISNHNFPTQHDNLSEDFHTCTCGKDFKDLLSKDIYKIPFNIMVPLLFGDGFTLLYIALKEMGVKDLHMSDWDDFMHGKRRTLQYTTTATNFSNNHTNKYYQKRENYLNFNLFILIKSRMILIRFCVFESSKFIMENDKCELFYRIVIKKVSESESVVQCWFHVHFDNNRHTDKKMVKQRIWMLKLYNTIQQHLYKEATRININLIPCFRNELNGPRMEKCQAKDHVSMPRSESTDSSSTRYHSPPLPPRKITKRIRVNSRKTVSEEPPIYQTNVGKLKNTFVIQVKGQARNQPQNYHHPILLTELVDSAETIRMNDLTPPINENPIGKITNMNDINFIDPLDFIYSSDNQTPNFNKILGKEDQFPMINLPGRLYPHTSQPLAIDTRILLAYFGFLVSIIMIVTKINALGIILHYLKMLLRYLLLDE
jgi:hypothetical protein